MNIKEKQEVEKDSPETFIDNLTNLDWFRDGYTSPLDMEEDIADANSRTFRHPGGGRIRTSGLPSQNKKILPREETFIAPPEESAKHSG